MKVQIGSLGSILVAAFALSMSRPPVAVAECTFIPPYPPITKAIPSARDIVVGTVVDGDPAARLRVTEVLRGDHQVGEELSLEIAPNWPWSRFESYPPFPSCNSLYAKVGEVIALALHVRQPAQRIRPPYGVPWEQPATFYNAMGVIVAKPVPGEPDVGQDREVVSLIELRSLASMPRTDSIAAPDSPAPGDTSPIPLIVVIAAGLIAAGRFRSHVIQRR
jgi:hypothetical protein